MARIYYATCTHCFYKAQVGTGGTRHNFTTDDRFPAICFNCTGLVHINRIPSPPVCYECNGIDVIPYGDKTRNPNDKADYLDKDSGKLCGAHFCPVCKEYKLLFEGGRFID